MFRPSTVATWSAICSPCIWDCCNWPIKSILPSASVAGAGDHRPGFDRGDAREPTRIIPTSRGERIGKRIAATASVPGAIAAGAIAHAATLAAGCSLLARLASNKQPVIAGLTKHPDEQVRWWAGALARQAQAWLDEVNSLAPLATLPPPPPRLWQLAAASDDGSGGSIAQLRCERIDRDADTARHRPTQLGVVGQL